MGRGRVRDGGDRGSTGSGAGKGLTGSGHAHPGLPEVAGTPHSDVDPDPTPPPITGEDLWRWQKQNPSGFGAQA